MRSRSARHAWLAVAMAAGPGASAGGNPLEWEVDYDDMLGMWRHESAAGHVVEVLLERAGEDGGRRVSLCWATQPHGFQLEVDEVGRIERGKTRNDEPYLEIDWRGGWVRLYPGRQGKPLEGVVERPVYRRPRGKGLHCLHRFERTAPPERGAPGARWRISEAEPLIGYWAGTLDGAAGTAAAAITDIDGRGQASGVVCASPRTARGYTVIAQPFGAARPSGGGTGTLREDTHAPGAGEGAGRRIEVEARRRRADAGTDLRVWTVGQTGDVDVTWLARTESDGRVETHTSRGELGRTDIPDGCLRTVRPMLPAMTEPAVGGARRGRVKATSDGRWRHYTR